MINPAFLYSNNFLAAPCTPTPTSAYSDHSVSLMRKDIKELKLEMNQMMDLSKGHIIAYSKKHSTTTPILLEDLIEDPCQTVSQLEQLEKNLTDGDCKKSELV